MQGVNVYMKKHYYKLNYEFAVLVLCVCVSVSCLNFRNGTMPIVPYCTCHTDTCWMLEPSHSIEWIFRMLNAHPSTETTDANVNGTRQIAFVQNFSNMECGKFFVERAIFFCCSSSISFSLSILFIHTK